MPGVVGIRFKACGKIYDFEVNGLEVRPGDRVVVESEFGLSIGNVVAGPRAAEDPGKELKKILRLASEDDVKQKRQNEQFEREARSFCLERIMARGLPMKLVCSEVTLDRKRIIFYFTADGRIDFRELVKDLAARFRTRIEMRQIGVRDKAKMVGGLGLCGKELCCRLFLTSFEPISIKMAKQQELVLNTGKLSGVCGRLMCCLGYEYSEAGPASRRIAAAGPEEQTEAVADEALEPFDEPEPLPEIVCCLPENASPEAAPAATAPGAQTTEKGKRRRRRRRFRKRSKQNE
ncbi:MAG: stage 0 sporulation family protein [Nitrospiraceae bacterium]|nr:stage 0 sporulation family protein [Nitrospiraceae bacterium]